MMKSIIREKRKLFFEKKIITPSVIRDFANIVDMEVHVANDAFNEPFVVFSIDSDDDSSYESQSCEIFREGDILDKKGAVKVSMRFNTRDYTKNIEVQLVHVSDIDEEGTGKENFLLVSGDDPTWVNGILARFNEIISLAEDQSDYKRFVRGSVLVTILVMNIIYFRIFYSAIEKIESGWMSVFLTLGFPLLTFGASDRIIDYIASIWPDMEFQTGPGHLQRPSLKRKKLAWGIATLLIPVFIGIVYDIIKSYL